MAVKHGILCRRMNGWETVLAAIGGMLLGFGMGATFARRGRASRRGLQGDENRVVHKEQVSMPIHSKSTHVEGKRAPSPDSASALPFSDTISAPMRDRLDE